MASRKFGEHDVRIEGLAVADHFELDPVGLQRLTGKFSGQDGIVRGLATGSIRQKAIVFEQADRVRAMALE